MMELPPDISPNDIAQWLEGGVFYARRGRERPWFLATYNGVRDNGQVDVFHVGEPERSTVHPHNICVHWPKCGAINIAKGFAVYVQRLQRKQYRRTYNSRCIRTSVPGKWQALKRLQPEDIYIDHGSHEFIQALFEPEYPLNTYEAIHRMTQGEWASVALNPQIILARTRVYYRGELVGRLRDGYFFADCDELLGNQIGKQLGVPTICR